MARAVNDGFGTEPDHVWYRAIPLGRVTEIPLLAIWRKGGNPMKKSMKDEIKGKFHEVKGSVKEKAGKVTNNPDLKAESHALSLPTASIGDLPAVLKYAGIAPGTVGVAQMNMVVPALAAGDYALQVSIGGVKSNSGLISV